MSAGAVRRLVQALREHLTLSRFHAIVGIIAGFISISVGLYTYLHFSKPGSPVVGEIVAIVQDARTGKPVADATVEILTVKDAVVTTEVRLRLVQPGSKTGPLDEAVGAVKKIFK